MSNVVSIDNVLGSTLFADGDSDHQLAVLLESDIYGSGGSDDCPDGHKCFCKVKRGIMTFGANHGTKDFLIEATSPWPMQHIHSYGSWAAATDFYDVRFHNFAEPQPCGAEQYVFTINMDQSDFIPIQRMTKVEFDNVHGDRMAWIADPPEKWNDITDCIGFPCTAPSNFFFDFKSVTYSGKVQLPTRQRNYQVIADTPGVSETFDNCELVEKNNAWHCDNDYLG